MDESITIVHIECVLRNDCRMRTNDIEAFITERLEQHVCLFEDGPLLADHDDISALVDSLSVCDLGPGVTVSFWQALVQLHVLRLLDSEPQPEYLDLGGEGGGDGSGDNIIAASMHWELPCRALASPLWDSVIVDSHIKQQLLGYSSSALVFADAGVDTNIISWNRMVLLHGPPGTGKTTLCKALAQKAFVRSPRGRYHCGVLVEVRSHALMSKWFSESAKMVLSLFGQVLELAASDPGCFVALLIDEVESLASCRQAGGGKDPGDASRVVTSLLTALDGLRALPNVLVLCTSNVRDGIDQAFLDRLDVQLFIGPPCLTARLSILQSCIQELQSKGIIVLSTDPPSDSNSNSHDVTSPGMRRAGAVCTSGPARKDEDRDMDGYSGYYHSNEGHAEGRCSSRAGGLAAVARVLLLRVAKLCEGMSGRSLRKLPLRAHAFRLQRPQVSLMEYLEALEAVALEDTRSRPRNTDGGERVNMCD